MADTFTLLQEAAQDFRPLHDRNDKDADLVNLIDYKLKETNPDTGAVGYVKDAINMTMPDPQIFANRIQALMTEASWQSIVKGRHLTDADTSLIESFDADIRYEIDQQLMLRSIPSLFSFLVEQACIRGTVAARYVAWEDKGSFMPDLLPCDSRYLLYEFGRKDLAWASFTTTRTRTAFTDEYPLASKLVPDNAKKVAVTEYWNKTQSEIWVSESALLSAKEGKKAEEKENKFKYVPFIIQPVGAGSMLQDEGSIARRGESILAPTRAFYEHQNMLGTVLQTLNFKTFNRVYLWESEGGTGVVKPPTGRGTKTLSIDKGTKGLYPMQVSDINNATRLLYALVLGTIQRGTLPNIDYGNLTFPLSAVAISKLTSTKDAIFAPRFQAIMWFYRKLHYMIKDQYIRGGYEAELGEEGLERTYKASDLDKKYTIQYHFTPISPEQDIANHAVAQQAFANKVPMRYIYENILKVKDPDGLIMMGRAERAEQMDPVIGLFRLGHALIDQGTEQSFLEAELVKDQIKLLLKQRYAPPAPDGQKQLPETSERGKSPASLLPLFDGGGGRGQPMSEMEELEMMPPEEMLRREERREEVVRKHESEG